MNILIVEDNPLIALDLKEMIVGMGINSVFIARDKKEALDVISAQTPDIVFLDVYLKNGENGLKLARANLNDSETKIIYLMGDTDQRLIQKVQSTNPFAIISKPFKEEDILPVLNEALRESY